MRMSPRKQLRSSSAQLTSAVNRLRLQFGLQVRDARQARGFTVDELATRAGLSAAFVYRVEAGQSGSEEAAARIASALGRRAELQLIDPRRRGEARRDLSDDAVHSAMGELEARRLRTFAIPTGIDEPYQHYQFAGRADVVAWDVAARALLHIENRTRFPDLQDMAGAFNAKKAYLAEAIGARVGVGRWASQTHVIAAVWTSEVLHAIRLRPDSFRSLCPDPEDGFDSWWRGEPLRANATSATTGVTASLIVLDPLARGRQRPWIGLREALTARPRHAGYADVAAGLAREIGHHEAA